MAQFLKQAIFILICLHYYCLSYNNFNELKSDMEMRVDRLNRAMENIYSKKCDSNSFQCPVKSFNTCEGTDARSCLTQFPVSPSCPGIPKYSMTSVIRIPNSVVSFNLSDEMKFFICKTAQPQVQSVFDQLLAQNNRRYAWTSIASNLGVSRVSPGFKYEKENATSTCKNYDPRLRPWFSQTIYGRKKMIIIIQNSKGIYDQPNRFTSMQMSLQALLQTSQQGDLFNIIQFSDNPRLFFSDKDMKLVSLSTLYQQYDKATNNSGLFYEAVANNITKSKSIEANYNKALQMALKVFQNSHLTNPQMENFILFFAGFKPTNLTQNYSVDMANMLAQYQIKLSTNFYFFGFGVTLHDDQGVKILNALACRYDGIYIDLNDVTYQSMFLDQAESYYDYLTQGNQINGSRWTDLYQDAFGLGKMVTVVDPFYYEENNVTKLTGVASMDVLAKQLTKYLPLDQIPRNLQVTKLPFNKNISICALQNLRKNYRCHDPSLINCSVGQFCNPSIQPSNQTALRSAIDTTDQDCCISTVQNFTGLIIGVVLGAIGTVLLIAFAIYCLIFRRRRKNDLQKTYAQIFSQFKDFDRTRIRSDSQISIIKD